MKRLILILTATLAVACSDSTSPEKTVANVVVAPATQQLFVGDEFTATARALDGSGRELTGRAITWTTGNPQVATVSATGNVVAVGEGTTDVTATHAGKSGHVTVSVTPAPVASVSLDVTQVALEEGETHQFVATLKDAAGRVLTGRFIQWTTSDNGVAIIGSAAKVTAIRPGTVTITARSEGKTTEASVTVSANYAYDLMYDGWSGVAGVAPELWRLDVRQVSGTPARIAAGREVRNAAPSPDGTRVAYVAYVNGKTQIFLANADGSGATQVVSTYDDGEPAWSPDGSKIAFTRDIATDGTSGKDVWVMNADGTGAVNLTADQGALNQHSPAWAPTVVGDAIVYSSQSNTPQVGTAHIWRMKSDGSAKLQITVGNVFDVQPAWSPDGTTIVFERYGTVADGALYQVNPIIENAAAYLLIDLPFGQFAPAWSPDGKMVAFTSKHGNGQTYQVYTVWADGSKLAQRTFDATDKANPSWIKR